MNTSESKSDHIVRAVSDYYHEIIGLIQFTDQKAGFLIIISGLMFSVFITSMDDSRFVSDFRNATGIQLVLFFLSTGFLTSMFFQIHCLLFGVIRPRIIQAKHIKFQYMMWSEAAKMSPDIYSQQFDQLSISEIRITLINHIHANSVILSEKVCWIIKSIKCIYISALFLIAYLLIARL